MSKQRQKYNVENLKPFKKGQSGNPAGKAKGVRNLSTILKEILAEEVEVEFEEGVKEKKEFQEVIIRQLIRKASKGDIKAITEILDRVEGKPLQKVKNENDTTLNVKFDNALDSLISPAPPESDSNPQK